LLPVNSEIGLPAVAGGASGSAPALPASSGATGSAGLPPPAPLPFAAQLPAVPSGTRVSPQSCAKATPGGASRASNRADTTPGANHRARIALVTLSAARANLPFFMPIPSLASRERHAPRRDLARRTTVEAVFWEKNADDGPHLRAWLARRHGNRHEVVTFGPMCEPVVTRLRAVNTPAIRTRKPLARPAKDPETIVPTHGARQPPASSQSPRPIGKRTT